jgi:hypothetical protein
MFLFRKSTDGILSLLYLIWNQMKAGIQLFVHADDTAMSDKVDIIGGSHKWSYRLEQSTIDENLDLVCIDLISVIERSRTSQLVVEEDDGLEDKKNSVNATTSADEKQLIQPCIDRIKNSYDSISQPYIQQLLLSKELFDIYGYDRSTMSLPPIHIKPQLSAKLSIARVAADVEEGEEVEEDSSMLEIQTEFQDTDYQAICAIDCEMSYTNEGLELTRLSLVSPTRGILYDSLVSLCMYLAFKHDLTARRL